MNKIIYLFFFCYTFAYADSLFLQNKDILYSMDNSLIQDTVCISTYNNDNNIPTQFNKNFYIHNNYEYYRGGEKLKNGNYNSFKLKKLFYTFKVFANVPIVETMTQNNFIKSIGFTVTLKNSEKYNNIKFLTSEEISNVANFINQEPFFMWKNYSAPVSYKVFDYFETLLSGEDMENPIDNINIKIPFSYSGTVTKKTPSSARHVSDPISYVSYVKCYTKK